MPKPRTTKQPKQEDSRVDTLDAINPVAIAQELIRCESVTPKDGGAIGVIEKYLEPIGFSCHPLTFHEPDTQPVSNLYARWGSKGKNFCFAGHTDVVPVGDAAAWKHPPFGGDIVNGVLYGRGAVDMKAAIAAFTAAAIDFLKEKGSHFHGSISMLITGDEESIAVNGTRKVLQWMQERNETMDVCLVGEPTNPDKMGQMAKIGRRGSITFSLHVYGTQGHVAYPQVADNPITHLVSILSDLSRHELDKGTEFFQPSHLEVTTVDVGNPAANVIPAKASATFNIRFNNTHTAETLYAWVKEVCDRHAKKVEIFFDCTGDAFLTKPGKFSEIVSDAIKQTTGKKPELSTSGGTSDARFIKDYCPVMEYGLINKTAHKVDEHIGVADIETLTKTYHTILEKYFAEEAK